MSRKEDMLAFAVDLAQKAALMALHGARDMEGVEVSMKSPTEVVTSIDRKLEEFIVESIARRYPGHGIVAEEDTSRGVGQSHTWFVDPLDGTNNFVRGIPFYGTSIALAIDGKPHLGVCALPVTGEIFWAQSGCGAFANGEKIRVSNTAFLKEAIVAVGLPVLQGGHTGPLERLVKLVPGVRGIRRLGSAALDFCLVASGRLDALWEEGLKPWDVAAGAVILSEAGGVVTRVDGSRFDLYKGDVVGGNEAMNRSVLASFGVARW
ncbi:MAG TPA: inositol monophosphatase family protein [Deltaproteobacteria bacterium]|nr:inositol monophosphatase family protein [Deltaproteobacteria bacterium]HOM28571.1 inositol monophosphatase family protein [Deltaproteobacteria bacterium]HPP79918.1 inositol monophosphatase family protein [Deltaproteobacteria bacterium]